MCNVGYGRYHNEPEPVAVAETLKMEENKQRKWKRKGISSSSARINNLDDGCLMHIFSFLSPIPGIPFSVYLKAGAIGFNLLFDCLFFNF